jgi:transcriptional regulator with XRE-family HTH domain
MENDRFLNRLKEALLREAATHPTTEEIEEFMSGPADPTTTAALYGMRKEFAEKVLLTLHPEPVRRAGGVALGPWIEEVRKKARLSHGFIASALGETISFVERLETGETLPWTIPADLGSDLASLFRLHYSTLRKLVGNSRKTLEKKSGTPSETDYSEILAGAGSPNNLDPDLSMKGEIEHWLEEVRRNLEEKQARELLD